MIIIIVIIILIIIYISFIYIEKLLNTFGMAPLNELPDKFL